MKVQRFIKRRKRSILFCALLVGALWLVGCAATHCQTCGMKKASPAANANWSARVVGEQTIAGRRVLRYEHEPLREWGYPAGLNRYFSVILPTQPRAQAPLLVYLHSAGGEDEAEVPVAVKLSAESGPEFYGLAVNCDPKTEWWWGYHNIRDHRDLYLNCLTPTEARVLATVEWVARKYDIDRNRIYLAGRSMGGSGSLGLGLCRGDLFASIMVGVPAGADHVIHRMHFPKDPLDASATTATQAIKTDYLRRASGVSLPDPPPVFNLFSEADSWAVGQDVLMRLVQDGRMFMALDWGPYGHKAAGATETNPAVFEFPWTTLIKNEAYPVFTHASTDNHYPGLKGKGPDQIGQVNAYFRWKTLTDAPRRLVFELRLVRAEELHQPVAVPRESIVDVTPRRLQRFRVKPGRAYHWRLEREENVVASGTARPDAAGLLTIPRLPLTAQSARLVIRRPMF